ncbi:MAG: hypothetical protein H7210_12730 [Pyrinomonadaceae bacterium]|nr:hypothetical protein [Phycisphaerales bacterium]
MTFALIVGARAEPDLNPIPIQIIDSGATAMPRMFGMQQSIPARRRCLGQSSRQLSGRVARILTCVCAAAAAVPMIATSSLSASAARSTAVTMTPPEPEAIPRRWQLEIEPGPLRLASLDVPEVGKKTFFYFTYRVINNTGEDLLFAPAFELATERGVYRSGTGVPVAVTKTLLDYVQNSYIQDQISIIGQLLQGKENAKDGLVIWPADELNADEMTLYAAGFSGETATVAKPTSKDKPDAEKVVLRKSYQIKYHLSGDMSNFIGKEIMRAEPGRWIMR